MLPFKLMNSRACLYHCRRYFYTSSLWQSEKPALQYVDMFARLQRQMQVPLLKENETLFSPPLEKLKEAEKLFRPTRSHKIEWAARHVIDKPPPEKLPEVVFIGRSNVGKSSLISALFSKVDPKLLKIGISKKPGHTRSLHFFNVGKALTLVDAPGYGYNMPKSFVHSVEEYLRTRKTLTRTFLLLDSSVGISKHDYTGIEMLEEIGVPYVTVLTKADKSTERRLIQNIMAIQAYREEKMFGCLPQPFLVSPHTMMGIPLLQCFIAYLTGNIIIDGL